MSSRGSCASRTLPLAMLYAGNCAPTRAIAMSSRCGAGCCARNRTRAAVEHREVDGLVELHGRAARDTARGRCAGRAGRSPPGAAGRGRAPGGRSRRRCARTRPVRAPCRCGAPSSWEDRSAPPAGRGSGRPRIREGAQDRRRPRDHLHAACPAPSSPASLLRHVSPLRLTRRRPATPRSRRDTSSPPEREPSDHHPARREQVDAAAAVGRVARLAHGLVDGGRLVGVHVPGGTRSVSCAAQIDGAAVVEDARPGRARGCPAPPRRRG